MKDVLKGSVVGEGLNRQLVWPMRRSIKVVKLPLSPKKLSRTNEAFRPIFVLT